MYRITIRGDDGEWYELKGGMNPYELGEGQGFVAEWQAEAWLESGPGIVYRKANAQRMCVRIERSIKD